MGRDHAGGHDQAQPRRAPPALEEDLPPLTIFIIVVGILFAFLTAGGNLDGDGVDKEMDRQLRDHLQLLPLLAGGRRLHHQGHLHLPHDLLHRQRLLGASGTWLARFWLCIDYLMSNASVLNLLLISLDRYFSGICA